MSLAFYSRRKFDYLDGGSLRARDSGLDCDRLVAYQTLGKSKEEEVALGILGARKLASVLVRSKPL